MDISYFLGEPRANLGLGKATFLILTLYMMQLQVHVSTLSLQDTINEKLKVLHDAITCIMKSIKVQTLSAGHAIFFVERSCK